ncbi:hypothetical protein BGZ99_001903 [Dissophora globulifera]|uniref:Uncharacterized protein n=1 Tax=Dissophora globulifera TaxID=979702 RepID=A0A9P6RR26_9FUNG|nr:hypothetical protein BGZ99_001903 [Dissophora globulifera]
MSGRSGANASNPGRPPSNSATSSSSTSAGFGSYGETPLPPITASSQANDEPSTLKEIDNATHIVVEHARSGTVRTHVYSTTDGQPSMMEHIDPRTLNGIVSTIYENKIEELNVLVQSSLETTRSESLDKMDVLKTAFEAAEDRIASQVLQSTSMTIESQIKGELVPRLEFITDLLRDNCNAGTPSAKRGFTTASSAHPLTSGEIRPLTRDSPYDRIHPADTHEADPSEMIGDRLTSDPDVLDKLLSIEHQVDAVFRVVVNGEVPSSATDAMALDNDVAGTVDHEGEGAMDSGTLARLVAMRGEMLLFPDTLKEHHSKMQELLDALTGSNVNRNRDTTAATAASDSSNTRSTTSANTQEANDDDEENQQSWQTNFSDMMFSQRHGILHLGEQMQSVEENLVNMNTEFKDWRQSHKMTLSVFLKYMYMVFKRTESVDTRIQGAFEELRDRSTADLGHQPELLEELQAMRFEIMSVLNSLPNAFAGQSAAASRSMDHQYSATGSTIDPPPGSSTTADQAFRDIDALRSAPFVGGDLQSTEDSASDLRPSIATTAGSRTPVSGRFPIQWSAFSRLMGSASERAEGQFPASASAMDGSSDPLASSMGEPANEDHHHQNQIEDESENPFADSRAIRSRPGSLTAGQSCPNILSDREGLADNRNAELTEESTASSLNWQPRMGSGPSCGLSSEPAAIERLCKTVEALQESIASMVKKYSELAALVTRQSSPPSPDAAAVSKSNSAAVAAAASASAAAADAATASAAAANAAAASVAAIALEEQSTVHATSGTGSFDALERDPLTLLHFRSGGVSSGGLGSISQLSGHGGRGMLGVGTPDTAETRSNFMATTSTPLSTEGMTRDMFLELDLMNRHMRDIMSTLAETTQRLVDGQDVIRSEFLREFSRVTEWAHPDKMDAEQSQLRETEAQAQQGDATERRTVEIEELSRATQEAATRADVDRTAILSRTTMIPSIMTTLDNVNQFQSARIETMVAEVMAMRATTDRLEASVKECHVGVHNILAGSLEDSSVLRNISADVNPEDGGPWAARFSDTYKTVNDILAAVGDVRRTSELTRAQQEALARSMDELHRKQDEGFVSLGKNHDEMWQSWLDRHAEVTANSESWHAKHDRSVLAIESWQHGHEEELRNWHQGHDERISELGKMCCPRCASMDSPSAAAATEGGSIRRGSSDLSHSQRDDESTEELSDASAPGSEEQWEHPYPKIVITEPSVAGSPTGSDNHLAPWEAAEHAVLSKSGNLHEVSDGNGHPASWTSSSDPAESSDIAVVGSASKGPSGSSLRGSASPIGESANYHGAIGSPTPRIGESQSYQGAIGSPTTRPGDVYENLGDYFAPDLVANQDQRIASEPHSSHAIQQELTELRAQYAALEQEKSATEESGGSIMAQLLEKNRQISALHNTIASLEQELERTRADTNEEFARLKEKLGRKEDKLKRARAVIEELYRQGLGLPARTSGESTQWTRHTPDNAASTSIDRSDSDDSDRAFEELLNPRSSMMLEAAQQLRQALDEFKEQKAGLHYDIDTLNNRKGVLLEEIALLGTQRSPNDAAALEDNQFQDVEEGENAVEENRDERRPRQRSRGPVRASGPSQARAFSTHMQDRRPAHRARNRSRASSRAPISRRGVSAERVPQLEADIMICKDGSISETLLSSKTVLTQELFESSRPKINGQDEDEIWSLQCDFKVRMVEQP